MSADQEQIRFPDHASLMRASSSPSSACLQSHKSIHPTPTNVTPSYAQLEQSSYQAQDSSARTSKSCDNLEDADQFSNFEAASSEQSITIDTQTLTAIEILRSSDKIGRQVSSEASVDLESSPSEKPEPPPAFKDRIPDEWQKIGQNKHSTEHSTEQSERTQIEESEDTKEERKAVSVIEKCLMQKRKREKERQVKQLAEEEKIKRLYGVSVDEETSTTSGSFMIETPSEEMAPKEHKTGKSSQEPEVVKQDAKSNGDAEYRGTNLLDAKSKEEDAKLIKREIEDEGSERRTLLPEDDRRQSTECSRTCEEELLQYSQQTMGGSDDTIGVVGELEEESSVYVTALSKTPTSSSGKTITTTTASSAQSRSTYETAPSDASWRQLTSPSTDEVDIVTSPEADDKTLTKVSAINLTRIFSNVLMCDNV